MLIGADGMLCCEVNRRRYLATPMDQRRVDIEPGDLVCWETYLTDPQSEPDPARWQTQLFVPLKG